VKGGTKNGAEPKIRDITKDQELRTWLLLVNQDRDYFNNINMIGGSETRISYAKELNSHILRLKQSTWDFNPGEISTYWMISTFLR
jgi:hypothetical protein